MFDFLKKLFKKECTHEYEVSERSNVIHRDDMGYALRLCICKCKKCGKYEQKWLESSPKNGDWDIFWKKVD